MYLIKFLGEKLPFITIKFPSSNSLNPYDPVDLEPPRTCATALRLFGSLLQIEKFTIFVALRFTFDSTFTSHPLLMEQILSKEL